MQQPDFDVAMTKAIKFNFVGTHTSHLSPSFQNLQNFIAYTTYIDVEKRFCPCNMQQELYVPEKLYLATRHSSQNRVERLPNPIFSFIELLLISLHPLPHIHSKNIPRVYIQFRTFHTI